MTPVPDPFFPIHSMPLVSPDTYNAVGASRRFVAASLVAAALSHSLAASGVAFDAAEVARAALAVADALLQGESQ
jgi:hypothetical protein